MANLRNILLTAAACAGGFLAGAAGLLWAHATVPATADVTGISGNAGEWEVTATLARVGDTRELAGPMRMTHIGWCSQDGPQEKAGRLSVRLARLSSSIEGRIAVDGVECSYSATLSDAYTGRLACPDRRPVQMLLWLR